MAHHSLLAVGLPGILAINFATVHITNSQKYLPLATRSQLTGDHLEAILHLSTTSIKPHISKMVADMQHHPSH